MANATALDLITAACEDLQIQAQGETLNGNDIQTCFARLNRLVDSWGALPETMAANRRQVFDLVANQATYTIGPSGDFNTVRPVFLTGAGVLQTTVTPNIEIPRPLITNQEYEAIQVKDLANLLPTVVYYNATFTSGLGTVTLWPVPNSTDYDLVLYSQQAVTGFADLTTSYTFPPSYLEALEYNLAVRIAPAFGAPVSAELAQLVKSSLMILKRANNANQMQDLPSDARSLTWQGRRWFNIQTGTGGS